MILDMFSENWNHSIIESSKRQNALEKKIIADGNNSFFNTQSILQEKSLLKNIIQKRKAVDNSIRNSF